MLNLTVLPVGALSCMSAMEDMISQIPAPVSMSDMLLDLRFKMDSYSSQIVMCSDVSLVLII